MIFHSYTLSPYHWIFMLVGVIVLFVVNMFIARYMHKDAIRREIKNSEFWLIMGFFLGVFGLLLYIFVRKNYELRT
ncbi:MAG: hypothetical protein ACFFG0_52225 [Candidatus Thorarchaeota archaeon]